MNHSESAEDAEAVKDRDFLLIEYQEASTAYFKGVDIGLSYMRSYFVVNGLLLAIFGSVVQFKDDFVVFGTVLYVIPAMAIAFSFLLMTRVSWYNDQLSNCSDRCEEIESEFGGQLFSRINSTTRNQSKAMRTMTSIVLVALLFLLLWVFVLFAGNRIFVWWD